VAWYDAQPSKVRDLFDEESHELRGDGTIAGVFDAMHYFPAIVGPDLVDHLLDDGGQARLDQAFRTPPVTTAQVFDPTAPAPVPVPLTVASGDLLDTGTLGQFGLAMVLGEPWAPDLSRVWRGDTYRTVRQDGETCIRLTVQTAGPADAQRLRGAFEVHYSTDIDGDRVSLMSCAT
jgi:hypothetical protein